MSYKMIAADMFISVETVRSHIKNIYKKLEVKNAASAVAFAINEKLV
jgi:DNA-binding NarL/FixJ family response regulator